MRRNRTRKSRLTKKWFVALFLRQKESHKQRQRFFKEISVNKIKICGETKMSTLGKTWSLKKCKRGHILENNRMTNGNKKQCRLCKNMRNALQREREYFREQKTPEKILSIDEFAKIYFKTN